MMPRAIDRTVDLMVDRPHVAELDEGWREELEEARRRYGAVTARRSGLYACPACGLLSARVAADAASDPLANASSALAASTVDGSDDGRAKRSPDVGGSSASTVRSQAPAILATTRHPAVATSTRVPEPLSHPGVECPRCGEPLHIRKPRSLAQTWAYLAAAFILYIPANVFPITDTRTLFEDQRDTIFSGVVYLWKAGSWPLALLVFFASIVVPLAKLIVLSGLALSAQRRVLRKPAQRTRLYRIVEFIGRWSMLDIYAVAILTALVQLKSLAEVTAGPGVLAFGAVCVLTIMASHAFDPRLMWDAIDEADADPDQDDD